MKRAVAALAGIAVLLTLAGAGPANAVTGSVRARAGDDWTLPGWVRPSANSGWIEHVGGRSPAVRRTGDGSWKTAMFRLPRPVLANRLSGGTDFRIVTGRGDDLDVRFVRLVRQNAP